MSWVPSMERAQRVHWKLSLSGGFSVPPQTRYWLFCLCFLLMWINFLPSGLMPSGFTQHFTALIGGKKGTRCFSMLYLHWFLQARKDYRVWSHLLLSEQSGKAKSVTWALGSDFLLISEQIPKHTGFCLYLLKGI